MNALHDAHVIEHDITDIIDRLGFDNWQYYGSNTPNSDGQYEQYIDYDTDDIHVSAYATVNNPLDAMYRAVLSIERQVSEITYGECLLSRSSYGYNM